MTVFLMAVFFGLLKTGSLIALLVDAYKGWTLFWKNYDRLPISTVHNGDISDASYSKESGNASEPAKPVLPAAFPARPASTGSTRW
ncbi:hypothetical protein [Klebsiella pneumoniae]|uniref:hypothetical protein n=1 Tax=Klebsiella pneumoniae TaxID=573 RepID=UPI0020636B0B|nr:hypothetical protein [Klebsiella pneumoniae]UPS70326.1 hypothetical protein M0M88_27420 [Klebsiella pneumoniae]